jgi:hypothetical protein
MKLIKHIIEGWWLYLNDTHESWQLVQKRKPICDGCELRNKRLNICNDCGCFLPAKQRVQDAQCPQNKW